MALTEKIGVTKEVRKQHPWIMELAQSKIAAANDRALRPYEGIRVELTDAVSYALDYAQLLADEASLTEELARVRAKILAVYQRTGTTRFPIPPQEIAVTGQHLFTLDPAKLPEGTERRWAKFLHTETVTTLDLPALLAHADDSPEDRDRILQALEVTFKPNVELAKPKAPPRTTKRQRKS